MKTLRIPFFVLLLSFVFFQKNIHAQTASVTEGCVPLEVTFTPPGGVSNYFWDFKDGATSTIMNPVNTFVTSGVYDVDLREGVGGALVGTVTVTVYAKPELMITATPPTGCDPLLVNFSDNSTIPAGINVTSYQWVFGDGNLGTGNPVANTYINPGSYTVGLDIQTNITSCNVTEIFSNIVTVGTIPDADFVTNPNPASACTGPFSVSFNNTTSNPNNYTYSWDFGNGATSTLVNPPAQTYNEGNFQVTMTISDGVGCSKTITKNVSVGLPTANFSIPDTVCLNQVDTISNLSSAGSYNWDFGSNAMPNTSTAQNPSVAFLTAGVQDIMLTVTSGTCTHDTTITVFVEEVDATFTADPTYTCEGILITDYTPNSTTATIYEWTFSDGQMSNEMNPTDTINGYDLDSFVINDQILYPVSLIVINSSGCMDTFVAPDTIHRPNALFKTDLVDGCVPLEVEFRDTSMSNENIVDWEWHFGDGTVQNFNNGDAFSYTYNTVGDFQSYLIITNEAGCKDTSYIIPIEVGEMITPSFAVDAMEVCSGDTINFQDLTNDQRIDTWHFETDRSRSFHCSDDPQLAWTYTTETGTMDVSLTVGYNGCFSTHTESDLVLVKGPIAKIDYRMECGSPYDFIFSDSSKDATLVTWDFGDSTSSNVSDLTHTYDTTGNYTVILSAENAASGCPISRDTMEIFIRDIEAVFELDSQLCYGSTQDMDASTSIDVYNDCWRGLTWFTTFNRPITTQDMSIPLVMADSGNHNITLVVTDINGCMDTLSQDVEIFATRPVVTVDDPLICFPTEVQFTDLTTGDTTIVEWNWNFGDGNTSTQQNPSHTYESTSSLGNFILAELTTTDIIGCEYSAFQFINIYRPTSQITAAPTQLCLGEEVNFSATDFISQGSNLTFDWDFDNGQAANTQNSSVTYMQEGIYNVQLSVAEISTGCPDTTNVMIEVQDFPVADFMTSVDNQNIICYPENIIFSDNTTSNHPLTYVWDFGNGQLATGSNPATSFGKGTFEITMIAATDFGCRDTIMEMVTLVGPEGDFDLDQSLICKGDIINFNIKDTVDISSYSWDFGDGTGADDVDPVSHQFNFLPPGSQTVVKLVLRGLDDACAIAVEKPIEIINVLADFNANDGVDSILCVGDVLFTNESINADISNWDFGDGMTSMEDSPLYTYDQAGTYFVELAVESSTLGCTDTLEQEVIVNPIPMVEIIADTICAGEDVVLDANVDIQNVTYLWSPATDLDDPTLANPIAMLSETTTFNLTVTDQNDCQGMDSEDYLVFPEPQGIVWDTVIASGGTATLPFNYQPDVFTYSWISSQGLSCENCSNPMVSPTEMTTYEVEVSDVFGCFTVSYTFTVDVFPEDIKMPNAFTPDSDGVNDFFNYVLLEGEPEYVETITFKIFNRWGEKVYDNGNPDVGWDGTHDGKDAPSDVYVYIIEVKFITDKFEKLDGDVTLIR